jgi:S-DNA-T family DNA segregation ATPase FtsK/SpoIIIE
VLGPEDIGLAPRLLRRLERECIRRLAEAAAGDPLLLLLVDGWDALAAGLPDIELLACTDTLANVLRIAPAAGLSIAVTGDRTTLAPRFAGGFSDRLVFRLADRGDYATAGIDPRAVPGELPRGRAVRAADGAALQIAEPIDVREVAAKWAGAPCPGSDAVRVRPLPARLQLADLGDRSSDGRLVIGLAGDERVPFTVDPFAGAGRLLVAGPPRSGRTTVLRTLAEQAAVAGIDTVVAAPARSPLVESARRLALRVVAPDDHVVDAAPAVRTLLVVDDAEAFTDAPAGDALVNWLRRPAARLAAVVAGRSDDLATSYRGIGAEVRRAQCGILLRPGPVDGELLGARLPRRPASGPPGRGVAVGEAAWGALFEDGEPVPVQVAMP